MIIVCPCGKKKFEIDSNLIPEKGRLLKCGSCDHTWFFNKNLIEDNKINEDLSIPIKQKKEKIFKNLKSSNNQNEGHKNKKLDKKGSEIIKYEPKSTFTASNFLSYILVFLISFIGLVIILDTFKTPLYNIFPQIEFILFNLFETIIDIQLFIKDLF